MQEQVVHLQSISPGDHWRAATCQHSGGGLLDRTLQTHLLKLLQAADPAALEQNECW